MMPLTNYMSVSRPYAAYIRLLIALHEWGISNDKRVIKVCQDDIETTIRLRNQRINRIKELRARL